MSPHGPGPESGQRPLPECLTRFLDMPASGLSAPGGPAPPAPRWAPPPPNRALRGTLVWALAYNLIGLAVIALLWQAMP